MIAFDNLHGQFPSKRPEKILSFLNLDGNLYGFLLFFFRVLRPPGGMSSNIFSDSDSASVTSSNESRASSTSPKTPQKQYKMASNFELGDEQPENPSPRRKPFKPSVNPLTGELVGCPGVIIPEEKPVRSTTRVPPGGYTTPLW